MEDYTAIDLWNDIDEGVRFHTNVAMGGKGLLEVTSVDEGLGPNGRWAFEATELESDEQCEWRYVVRPERGGPNGGVVEAHWLIDGTPSGHHELYPRALDIDEPALVDE